MMPLYPAGTLMGNYTSLHKIVLRKLFAHMCRNPASHGATFHIHITRAYILYFLDYRFLSQLRGCIYL